MFSLHDLLRALHWCANWEDQTHKITNALRTLFAIAQVDGWWFCTDSMSSHPLLVSRSVRSGTESYASVIVDLRSHASAAPSLSLVQHWSDQIGMIIDTQLAYNCHPEALRSGAKSKYASVREGFRQNDWVCWKWSHLQTLCIVVEKNSGAMLTTSCTRYQVIINIVNDFFSSQIKCLVQLKNSNSVSRRALIRLRFENRSPHYARHVRRSWKCCQCLMWTNFFSHTGNGCSFDLCFHVLCADIQAMTCSHTPRCYRWADK